MSFTSELISFYSCFLPPGLIGGPPWQLPWRLSGSANTGVMGSVLGLEKSPGEGNSYPCQYYYLGNPWTEEPRGLQAMGSQRVTQLSNGTITRSDKFLLRNKFSDSQNLRDI